jgi:predicted nucleic acid-binding protein
MLSLDTNVLLRFALNDHPELSPLARATIQSNVCHVSLIAVAEMGYVMHSFYGAQTKDLVHALRKLMQEKNLRFENESRLIQALIGVEAGVDWHDALLWASTSIKDEVGTFDKKFSNKASKLGWQPTVRKLI